ncbi:hypothetical protein KUTeg_011265 [Tegillarca granosa]|uniref:Uncharacterized protein n=1 Tax=Tegillarca granosa TaxID=220873 RepID=A0ABQ9F1A6_TEGGR|nr:hypothetical protein KUTeg_011265 [Tegillarca granosa]
MNKALVVLGLIIRLVKSATKFHTMSCKSYQIIEIVLVFWVLTVYQCCRDVSYFSEVKLDEGCVDLLKLTDVDYLFVIKSICSHVQRTIITKEKKKNFVNGRILDWFNTMLKSKYNLCITFVQMKSTLFILLVLVVLGSALAGRRNKNRKLIDDIIIKLVLVCLFVTLERAKGNYRKHKGLG